MGLDVIAYQKLGKYLGPHSDELAARLDREWMESDDTDETYVLLFGGDFPERLDGLKPGYYRVSGDRFSFRAGAYSAYGRWRGRLAEIAWGVKYDVVFVGGELRDTLRAWTRTGQPFFELVWFSDCNGVIGPKTCTKLAADFAAFEKQMEEEALGDDDLYHEHDPQGIPFMVKYLNFKRAFELASESGIVHFG